MAAEKLVLAQLSDPQIGFKNYDDELKRFHREIDMLNETYCHAVVICGDMMHITTRESLTVFKKELDRLKKPVYMVAGNHDVCQKDSRGIYTEFFGPTYYAVDMPKKSYRLIVMDSNIWQEKNTVEMDKMDAFMIKELEAAKAKGQSIIMAMHCPIFINDMDEKEEYFNLPLKRREWLMEKLQAYKVAAMLTGHTHTAFAYTWKGILFSSAETTSVAFDNVNYGYRKLVFNGDVIRFAAVPVI